MTENTFEAVYKFIVDAFPQYKNNKLSVSKITELLKNLLDDRVDELTQRGIHKDDWPDDEEIQQLEEYICSINDSN
jgi:predicted HTH domain antitoxin